MIERKPMEGLVVLTPAQAEELATGPIEHSDLPWHIVRRVGKSDQHALDWLKRMNLRTYYPLVREMRPVPRDKLSRKQRSAGITLMRPSLVPFFAGYIFVQMQMKGLDWQRLKDIAGLGGLVSKDGILPVRVSNELIDAIRSREVGGAVPGRTPAKLIFKLGQSVRITSGPFASFEGLVEKLPDAAIEDIDSETRIRVALEVFGQPTPVDLPLAFIEKK